MAAAGVNWTYAQTYDEGPAHLLEAVKLAQSLGNDVNAVNSMGVRALHGRRTAAPTTSSAFWRRRAQLSTSPTNRGARL